MCPRRIIIVLLALTAVALSLPSCSSKMPGYTETSSGILYKLVEMGEDTATPRVGDFVTIDFAYKTMADSQFYAAKRKVQVTAPDYEGAVDECFAMLSEGDSAEFIIKAQPFFEKTLGGQLPSFLDSNASIKICIKNMELQRLGEYTRQKEEFLAWIKDFKDFEKVFLKHYIEQENIGQKPSPSGMYKVIRQEGSGSTPAKGDTVKVSYTGKFLNGTFFDGNQAEKRDFEFVVGIEWQVIKGMDEAIRGMTEGETSVFVMPSDLAWAEKGSGANIVPPYTSVIFEVTLRVISKGDSTGKNILVE